MGSFSKSILSYVVLYDITVDVKHGFHSEARLKTKHHQHSHT